LVRRYSQYSRSSAGELLSENLVGMTDREFVLDLFGDKDGFLRQMALYHPKNRLQTERSRFGEILGGDGFSERTENRLDHRCHPDAVQHRRRDDRYFEPLAKVWQEFEDMKGIKLEALDVTTWRSKRVRGELLVTIRERCGLKYSEINELPLFSDIQPGSIRGLYWHTKKHAKENRSQDPII
jgi:hypothetical protein